MVALVLVASGLALADGSAKKAERVARVLDLLLDDHRACEVVAAPPDSELGKATAETLSIIFPPPDGVTQSLLALASTTTSECSPGAVKQALEAALRKRFENKSPEPVAIVSGGGVSMGSYQAGRLQGIVNHRRVAALQTLFNLGFLAKHRTALQRVDRPLSALLAKTAWAGLGIQHVAGASAGGMNALGLAIEACRDTLLPTFRPVGDGPEGAASSDSVLRLLWTDVGFDEPLDASGWAGGKSLFGTPEDRNALFSAEVVQNIAQRVSKFFTAPPRGFELRSGCNVGLAFTITSLTPVPVEVMENGSFPSITVPVQVDLAVNGQGHLGIVEPEPKTTVVSVDAPPVMTTRDVSSLLTLVKATGAIPPALPSLRLKFDADGEVVFGKARRYSVEPWNEQKARLDSEGSKAEKPKRDLELVDGGVLNNNPLDLLLNRLAPGVSMNVLFFDDDFYGVQTRPTEKYIGRTLYVKFQPALNEGAGVLTQQQVTAALRRTSPTTKIYAIGRQSPALGRSALATSAFIHRRIRAFDYLLGTIDAEAMSGGPEVREPWKEHDSRTWISEVGLVFNVEQLLSVDCDSSVCTAQDLEDDEARVFECFAAAAKRVDAVIKDACGDGSPPASGIDDPAESQACKDAWTFASFGRQLHAIGTTGGSRSFYDSVHTVVDRTAAEMSRRIRTLAYAQQSGWNVTARAIDWALESILVDGLQFDDSPSTAKRRRLVGGWRGSSILRATDVRVVIEDRFWAPELSWRSAPWLVGLKRWSNDFHLGLAPSVSAGLGVGLACAPLDVPALGPCRYWGAAANVPLTLMLVNAGFPEAVVDVGLLANTRGTWLFRERHGYDLRAGLAVRFTLGRTLSLEGRFLTPTSSIGLSSGSHGAVLSAGWDSGLALGYLF